MSHSYCNAVESDQDFSYVTTCCVEFLLISLLQFPIYLLKQFLIRGQYPAGRVYWKRQGGREGGQTGNMALNLLLLPVHSPCPSFFSLFQRGKWIQTHSMKAHAQQSRQIWIRVGSSPACVCCGLATFSAHSICTVP